MPTGYTCDIEKGITFQEYAIGCARAFGACIEMRDDPKDKPIPEKFMASDYDLRELKKAQNELVKVKAMSLKRATAMAEDEYKDALAYYKKTLRERAALEKKYQDMLAKVKGWTPPSKEHTEFKKFMELQITDSIEGDCRTDYVSEPVKLSGAAWKKKRLASIMHDITYHTKGHKAELERVAGRNNWIRLLRNSL